MPDSKLARLADSPRAAHASAGLAIAIATLAAVSAGGDDGSGGRKGQCEARCAGHLAIRLAYRVRAGHGRHPGSVDGGVGREVRHELVDVLDDTRPFPILRHQRVLFLRHVRGPSATDERHDNHQVRITTHTTLLRSVRLLDRRSFSEGGPANFGRPGS